MKIYGPHWVVSLRVELAATFDWLGDYARATEYAQRALGRAIPGHPAYPIYPSSALASIALHQGNRAQAAAWLAPFSAAARDEYFGINFGDAVQVFSVPMELALAQNEPDRALALADRAIALLRNRGMAIALPSILRLQAQALSMLNRADEAYALLIDARRQAEAMQSRYRLLPILFTLFEWDLARGDAPQAEQVRRQAREVIDYITAHLPAELLQSFLNLSDVSKAMRLNA
jgi:hypothetical protein